MNPQYLTAGALSLLATLVHAFTGEHWIFPHLDKSALPLTPFGDSEVTSRMQRVVWHLVILDFLISGIALLILAEPDFSESSKVAARIISLHFAGYVLVVLVVAVRRVAGLVRAPQLILFAAISALAWWGAS